MAFMPSIVCMDEDYVRIMRLCEAEGPQARKKPH